MIVCGMLLLWHCCCCGICSSSDNAQYSLVIAIRNQQVKSSILALSAYTHNTQYNNAKHKSTLSRVQAEHILQVTRPLPMSPLCNPRQQLFQ